MNTAPHKTISSTEFSQLNVDMVGICDGGLHEGENHGGIGYTIEAYQTKTPLAEGSIHVTKSHSTVELEWLSVLRLAEALLAVGASSPIIRTDYEGILTKICQEQTDKTDPYVQEVHTKLEQFDSWSIQHVSRTETERADALARQAYERVER